MPVRETEPSEDAMIFVHPDGTTEVFEDVEDETAEWEGPQDRFGLFVCRLQCVSLSFRCLINAILTQIFGGKNQKSRGSFLYMKVKNAFNCFPHLCLTKIHNAKPQPATIALNPQKDSKHQANSNSPR